MLIFVFGPLDAQAGDPADGYAIVRSDTIYGKIKINFDTGSIMIQQDSVNRMFLSGIELVRINNEDRETYLPISSENRTVFYKVLVHGETPLLQAREIFFTHVNGEVTPITEEKDLYNFFDKRAVKDYIFIRNIQISEENGMKDVFSYFNRNESF